MKKLLILVSFAFALSPMTALAVLIVSTAAQADILCTQQNGCRETGKTLRNNGGVYNHLSHTPRNMTKDQLEGKAPRPTRVLPTIYN
jgi:hypothetical protein